MKYFAIHLKRMRTEKGWDQETIAHMAGLSVRTIQRIEAGNSCSLDTLKSLSAAMELTHFSELLPKPEACEYQPTKLDVLSTLFRELVWRNGIHAISVTLVLIGAVTIIFTFEMATSYPRTYDERLEAALTMNELAKQQNETFFLVKSRDEIENEVRLSMKTEAKPMTKDEWNKLFEVMKFIFGVIACMTTFFSCYRLTRTYTPSRIVVRPLKNWLGKKLNFAV